MRLSDIEILGAIGDSDTAAFAARSTGIHTYFTGGFLSNSVVTNKGIEQYLMSIYYPLQIILEQVLPPGQMATGGLHRPWQIY